MNMQQEFNYLEQVKNSLQKAYQELSSHISEKDKSYKDLLRHLMDYKAELDKFEIFSTLFTRMI